MPFHEFNNFTGRLKQSTHLQPLYPLSPTPLQRTEPPTMMYDSVNTKPVRTSPSTGASGYSTLSPKLERIYKKYQVDLEKPSYLLAGKKDKLFLGMTFALLGFGLAQNLYFLGTNMYK